MKLSTQFDEMVCRECGSDIQDRAYIPASEVDDGYNARPEAAVCDMCGYNEIGMMGCAPELDEAGESDQDDVLLHIENVGDQFEVLSTKT